MKKAFFLSIFAVLTACSNELPELGIENENPSTQAVSVVRVEDGQILPTTRAANNDGELTLRFRDEKALNDFEAKLSSMSDAQAQQTINDLGVENLYDLSEKADDELERIGEQATSIEDFNAKYKEFLAKYQGLLARDNRMTESLSLIVPGQYDGKKPLSFILNQKAQIVVGNEVRTVDTKSLQASPSTQLFSTNAIATNSNDVYDNGGRITYPGKRIYYQLIFRQTRLNFGMSAEKKMWYGWKADKHRNFYYIPELTNFTYAVNNVLMYVYVNRSGFETILGTPINPKQPVKGQLYIWTDITSEKDANGNELTQEVAGITFPLCKAEKAVIMHPNITNPNQY